MIKVIFRKFKPLKTKFGTASFSPEVIALFPEIIRGEKHAIFFYYIHCDRWSVMDYQFILKSTVPAKKEEYKSLLEKLNSLGYNDLKVIEKFPNKIY